MSANKHMSVNEHMNANEPTHVAKSCTKIWEVVSEPYTIHDVPPDEWPLDPEEYPNACFVLARVEHEGEVSIVEYYFSHLEDAYEVVKKLKVQIEPVEMN